MSRRRSLLGWLLLISLSTSWAQVGPDAYYSTAPRPVITVHEGHIGLYDQMLETQYGGKCAFNGLYVLLAQVVEVLAMDQTACRMYHSASAYDVAAHMLPRVDARLVALPHAYCMHHIVLACM